MIQQKVTNIVDLSGMLDVLSWYFLVYWNSGFITKSWKTIHPIVHSTRFRNIVSRGRVCVTQTYNLVVRRALMCLGAILTLIHTT